MDSVIAYCDDSNILREAQRFAVERDESSNVRNPVLFNLENTHTQPRLARRNPLMSVFL